MKNVKKEANLETIWPFACRKKQTDLARVLSQFDMEFIKKHVFTVTIFQIDYFSYMLCWNVKGFFFAIAIRSVNHFRLNGEKTQRGNYKWFCWIIKLLINCA